MGDVHRPAPWMVRVLDAGGAVCGAGMLVAADRVLTCAHVVPDPVAVGFVDPPEPARVPARVAPDGWVPASSSERGDLAVLALEHPQPDRPVAVLRRFPLSGGVPRVRAYGFPRPDFGEWALARSVGRGGPGTEWIQLHTRAGPPIRPGFSGAAVIAEPSGHLVGMVVAANAEHDSAWMIPVETILRYLPAAAPWVAGPPAVDPAYARRRPCAAPDTGTAREIAGFLTDRGVTVYTLVIGDPGSAAAAAVHRAVTATDRESGGPAGDTELPPVGSVDLTVDTAGRSTDDIRRLVAERAGVDPHHLAGDDAPPMTIVLHRVDAAADPRGVLEDVVGPLTERDANRVLMTFEREGSDALAAARSIRSDRSSRHDRAGTGTPDLAAAARGIAELRDTERAVRRLRRRAARLVAGLPEAPARGLVLRLRLTALHAAAREHHDVTGPAADLLTAVTAAVASAAALRDDLHETVDRHTRLRGLLSAYQRSAAAHGLAEDAGLQDPYRRAYALLHDGPADLPTATAAVDDFLASVRARRRGPR